MPNCSKCFQPNSSYTFGMCELCKKEYKSVYNGFYRAAHKQEIKEKDRLWRDNNREKVQKANTDYKRNRYIRDEDFRQRAREAQRAYRQRQKEQNSGRN